MRPIVSLLLLGDKCTAHDLQSRPHGEIVYGVLHEPLSMPQEKVASLQTKYFFRYILLNDIAA
jgi:hypothetical protein